MKVQERIKRDGPRWRYIKALEDELTARRTRVFALRVSLFLNGLFIALLIAGWAA